MIFGQLVLRRDQNSSSKVALIVGQLVLRRDQNPSSKLKVWKCTPMKHGKRSLTNTLTVVNDVDLFFLLREKKYLVCFYIKDVYMVLCWIKKSSD